MPRLGIFDHLVPGSTLEERLANLEALGFEGVQFGRRTLELGWPAIRKALAGTNVRVCTVSAGGGRLLVPDKAARAAVVERLKAGLRLAAEMDAVGVITVPAARQPEIEPPAGPQTLHELEREILIEELSKVAPVAEETGRKVIIEPLNRYETHFVQRPGQGAEICRAIGSPGIKVMADFFHMSVEEPDLAEAIVEAGDQIAYVHLADSNRYQPGAGHLDFRAPLAALKRIGYDGWLTFECRILAPNRPAALRAGASWVGGVTEPSPLPDGTMEALADAVKLVRSIWDEV